MTSHLTVTSTTGSASTAPTGLSSSGKGTPSTALGGFGAILDAVQSVGGLPGAVAADLGGLVKSAEGKAAGSAATTTGIAHTGFVELGGASATAVASVPTDTAGGAVAAAVAKATNSANAAATSTDSTADNLIAAIEKLLNPNAPTTTDNTVSAPLGATGAVDATADTLADAADAGTPPKLMKELVASLKALDKAEQSGQPVDQDMLKRVKKAVDGIASFLAAQQPAAPIAPAAPADASGGSAGAANAIGGATPSAGSIALPTAAADDGTAAGGTDTTNSGAANAKALTDAAGTLKALDGKIETLAAAVAKTDPELSTKLTQLAKALSPATVSADTVSQLGLNAKAPTADPSLTAAITGLVTGKEPASGSLQPALGSAQLKLPAGTSLGDAPDDKAKTNGIGHAAASTQAAPPSATATSDAKNNSSNGGKPGDKGSDQPQPATTTAAATPATPPAADKPTPAIAATPATAAAAQPVADASATASAAAATAANPATLLAHATYQAATPATPVNLPQMAYEIVRHVQAGANHFQIRLDPADMGRVDVKLSIDAGGSVSARLTVERPETLDLLRRDSAQLGQALTQAGMDASKTNLQFSLSQNPFTRQNNNQQGGSFNAPTQAGDDTDAVNAIGSVASTTVYRGTASASGLNIFV